MLLVGFYTTYSIACTVIAVGKRASKDGSVIISHTDAGPDCRVHFVPGQKFPANSKAPVYWGMVDLGDLLVIMER